MNTKIFIIPLLVIVVGLTLFTLLSSRAKQLSQNNVSVETNDTMAENVKADMLIATTSTSDNTSTATPEKKMQGSETQNAMPRSAKIKTALLADGCFWCAEHDMAKVKGVQNVVSGYAGGGGENPTYKNYAEQGYREVIEVTYDANQVTFANLVEHIVKHGDPTDPDGSFHDRGPQYAPAIYYDTEEEKQQALQVIDAANKLHVFPQPITLVVIPRVKFFAAEEYHQDYSEKNPIRYGYYRSGSGRDAFIEKYWGNESNTFTISTLPSPKPIIQTEVKPLNTTTSSTHAWETYKKPAEAVLRKLLSPLAYTVTQEKGTEKPFNNLYDKNFAEGIYVDVLSGEPLYSSKDKFDSGTGWPSFVKPITPESLVLKEDKGFFSTRTEVRSRIADDHIGHVFDDGPAERGGKRYCMNSAAMRFIPKLEMEKQGYGDYLKYVISAQ